MSPLLEGIVVLPGRLVPDGVGATRWAAGSSDALVCHSRGIYLLDVNSRASTSGAVDRATVHSTVERLDRDGGLWAPEHIRFSLPWTAVTGWNANYWCLRIALVDGRGLRWQYAPLGARATASEQITESLERVTAVLDRAIGLADPSGSPTEVTRPAARTAATGQRYGTGFPPEGRLAGV